MKHPKVLVISPVKFNQQTGSGVTMGNLFRGWPLDSIAQIHSETHTKADYSICNQYYCLPYIKVRQTSRFLTISTLGRQIIQYKLHRQESLLGHWAHIEGVIEWSKEFKPDVIYARPLDRPSYSIWLPLKLSKVLEVPYITRILDDWPSKHENDPVLLRKLHWKMFNQKTFHKLIRNAAINLGISNEMCQAFKDKYKREFVSFQNCIEISDWKHIYKDYNIGNEFQIVYMGTVSKDKELYSLRDLKDVILTLNEQMYQIKLIIYGPEIYRKTVENYLERPPWIIYGGYFQPNEKQNILSQADLLILPINFDAASQAYIRYSFQTKVPEYMASGTPILVYGPSTNPNVRYASKGGWGAIVDKKDKIILAEMIIHLINTKSYRVKIGQRARELAFTEHNASIQRENFHKLIDGVTKNEVTTNKKNSIDIFIK